ncbi:hypothetical protein BaRGS_00040556, partial [Batillaria attramentaria]
CHVSARAASEWGTDQRGSRGPTSRINTHTNTERESGTPLSLSIMVTSFITMVT